MPWLWSPKRPPAPEEPAEVGYPPVAAGIPALPVERILRPHEETLAKIRHLVEWEQDWEKMYMPLIRRYALHVHLLPASEYHHHRGAGGLLAHGLEVGLYALQQAREKLYGLKLEPKMRRLARPRWQYGCFLAGLCHDVGKPLLLRVALTPAGRGLSDWDSQIWQPFAQDLLAWCRDRGAERYWVSFRKRQARDHERSAALIWDRVITEADRRFLSEYDSELLPLVLGALQGANADHDLGKLVHLADQRSVQEDLRKSNRAQDLGQDVGLPVMRIYGDAMLRLIREDVWLVNQPGGRLWWLESGLYLVWPEGGRDIGLKLDRDEAYRGVPRNTQVMAEVLHEWNYVEETPGGSPFWWIRVAGVPGSLLSVKIREPRGLLEFLPSPCPGEAWPYESGREGEREDSGGREADQSAKVEAQEIAAEQESQPVVNHAPGEPAGIEQPGQAGQANQGERASALARAGGVLRGCLSGTGRALWGCVPGGLRSRLYRWRQEEEGEMDCVEMWNRLSWLYARLQAHRGKDRAALSSEELEQYEDDLVEAFVLVRRRQMMCWGCDAPECPEGVVRSTPEPQWVREIYWLLADGVAVSEFEAERIKRRLGGSGRIRDWFEVSPEGYVLSGLE